MIEEFIDNDMLQVAARIANQFKQNVVDVLRSPATDWLIWNAAYRIIMSDKEKQAAEMKAKSKKK